MISAKFWTENNNKNKKSKQCPNLGLPKLPYQRQCSNYLFHLVLDCSKIHKAPARAPKHQLVLAGFDLKRKQS